MWFVDNGGITRPQINLAIEEFLLRNVLPEDDLLFLYINEPAIIVGRFQNTLEEINQAYVEEHGIHVVRRLSGGGAVYQDLNNLNFSYITPKDPESISNFTRFNIPVIRTLGEMGLKAYMGSRKELLVAGRKISGNAQYITGSRMVSHGTLLYNSDLTRLSEALHPKYGPITSKGTKSVRSPVTNIAEHLSEAMSMPTFRERIIQGLFAGVDPIPQYRLTDSDWQAIDKIAGERYMQWEWNYGSSPDFIVQKSGPLMQAQITVRLHTRKGSIIAVDVESESLDSITAAALQNCLTGVRYDRQHLRDALESCQIDTAAGRSVSDWLSLIYD
jgi:lipoate---protein ligase